MLEAYWAFSDFEEMADMVEEMTCHLAEKFCGGLQIEQSELARYGIERIPADVFLWGGYRYSNARDAVAAAKRGAKA